jgi:hypothetical protein
MKDQKCGKKIHFTQINEKFALAISNNFTQKSLISNSVQLVTFKVNLRNNLHNFPLPNLTKCINEFLDDN